MIFQTRGAPEAAAAMRRILPALQERDLKRIMRGVGQEIVEAAKANLTARDTGLLRDSLGLVVRAPRNAQKIMVVVGPRSGPEWTLVDPKTGAIKRRAVKYAHLVEFGTKPHQIVRKGIAKRTLQPWAYTIPHPGTQARPFMRPAFDNAGPAVQERIGREMGAAVERIAAGG